MEARTVEILPPVIRGAGTKNAEERAYLLSLLTDGKAHIIPNVEDRKAHNRLQQKIRNIAKTKGINVTVRYYPSSQETGVQALVLDNVAEQGTEKAVATETVSGTAKATSKSSK